jgi:hypothetical protein
LLDKNNPVCKSCWTFDGSSWAEVKASTQPPARAGAGMAFLLQ